VFLQSRNLQHSPEGATRATPDVVDACPCRGGDAQAPLSPRRPHPLGTKVADPALLVEDYSFWFKVSGGDRVLALEDVSLSVDVGAFVLILGASGSGKSTLALNLVGIYPDYFGGYNEGRILVNHPEKGLVNRRELDRGQRFRTVNMLFQNPEDQIVTLTVEEELAFALENYLVPASEIPARIDRGLDLVGLSGFKDRSTLKLSGGEKQRVALAAMLAMEPRVLILDEPTSNLDPVGTREVLEAVQRVRDRIDITLLIVEHEVDEVFHQVDKLLCVDGKKVQGPFSPREFIDTRGLHVRDRMGLWIPQASEVGLELRERGVDAGPLALTGGELVAAVKARPLEAQPPPVRGGDDSAREGNGHPRPRSGRVPGETVIEARDVCFSYPTRSDVLLNVSLDVRRGELLAVVGQNGSGKSTLASLMNGILKPSSGEVLVHGKSTADYKFADLAKRVAYIFQVPEKQFIRNTVADEMAHGVRALGLSEAEVESRVNGALHSVALQERKGASPYLLSHGQKRRLSVACMVVSEPEVVILDEPTFGQDWLQAQRLMDYLRELADKGAAVTFITHDMRLVAQYADRCVAMTGGEIIFDGTPIDLFSSAAVLQRASLKPPPVFEFSAELLGKPVLQTRDLIDSLEVSLGRSGTVVPKS
jgi:energy-coupling factor transport system ATP-binding protein